MIPKIIHYCWFGRNPKPKNIEKYISGWKEKLPGYEFKEWNEDNFDIDDSIPYVKQAYEAKKYAYVSDYVRLYALCNYGGVYFDTDIEVVKDFSDLLKDQNFVLGLEKADSITTAFIACSKGNPILSAFMAEYNERSFVKENGDFDLTTINEKMDIFLLKNGMDFRVDRVTEYQNGIKVFPMDYFSAFDMDNWHPKSTDRTYTIHHMNASWVNGKRKIYFKTILFLQKILGYRLYDWGKKHFKSIKNKLKKKS